MSDSIEQVRERINAFGVEIYRTELLLDGALKILEDARTERAQLQTRLARLMLEDAIEYPSEIFI